MIRFGMALALALCALPAGNACAQAVDVAAFVKRDVFGTIKISPTGEYYAATVPMEDRTVLVIMKRDGVQLVGSFNTGKNTHVNDFTWVNPGQVILNTVEKFGALDQPQSLGELFSLNVSGRADILVGQRVGGQQTGSNIKQKVAERVAAFLVDDLPNEENHVLVSIMPFTDDPYTRVERMDVRTGRRTPVVRAPVRNAEFVTDNVGEVRFAVGSGADNVSKLYYRAGEGSEWVLINDERASGRIEIPLGFSRDNKTAYLRAEQDAGPDAVVAMDVASLRRTQVLRDAASDPSTIISELGDSAVPVGVMYLDGIPRTAFFDNASGNARLYRSLQAAFAGATPYVTSSTADGKLALVQVFSDRNPGDFYIFDTVAKRADHVISRRQWFEPDKMAEMRPVAVTARDGLVLKGFITLPHGSAGKQLPMVVMPHGGPFGVYDTWGFEDDAQLLATAGYAVLQVNFRGSGNQGRAFEHAGARQWGGKMQDDVTDATRWAIEQGYASAGRICIYGASYGAYAALMGAAREPDLYRCAVGYVGVYDLPTMHTHGDIQRRGSGETYLREWIGEKDALAAVSPNRMADKIKVPVLLVAGGEDERAPIEHSRMMEKALKAAGTPVETLYYPNEGHGFYLEAHRKEFYTRLLGFLDRHLAGKTQASTD